MDRQTREPTADPSSGPVPGSSWLVLGTGLFLVALTLALPEAARGVGVVVTLASAAAAAVPWYRLGRRAPTTVVGLAVGLALLGLGGAAFLAVGADGGGPFPAFGDAFSLLGSVCFVVAIARLSGGWPPVAGLVDTVLVALLGALVFWVFIVAPAMADGSWPPSTAAAFAYPALHLVSLGLLVGLLLESGQRSIGLGLVRAAIGLLLAAASVRAVQVLAGVDGGGIVAAGSLMGYVLLASAANHPSLLAGLPRTSSVGLGAGRFVALATAALAAPILGAVEWGMRGRVDPLVATVGAGALSFFVLVRLGLAGRALTATIGSLGPESELLGGPGGTLSICASCKRIRGEAGGWISLEQFLGERSAARFSHGLCDECLEDQLRELS